MFFKFKTKVNKDSKAPKLTKQQEFQNIIRFAEKVIEKSTGKYFRNGEHPIFDVLKILAMKIQSEYMTRLLKVEDESDLDSLLPPFVFENRTILTDDYKSFEDLVDRIEVNKTATLSRDIVLPWPWKRERLINTISGIGNGRPLGPWKEDDLNHYLVLWQPLGLYWVHGGNHSISVGILQGTGTIKPEYGYDITNIYNYVTCDGEHFYRNFDNTIISEVKNVELAAMFEIGRMMIKNSITY